MASRLRAFAAALALAVPAFTSAQTPTITPTIDANANTLAVLRLAPQLLAFAGSNANFQSLVNGLALGQLVSLVTFTTDGLTQTVTFTPTGAMSTTDIARTLEAARQGLIARGIGAPTAVQIGVALVGGTLPTALGGVPVAGLLPPATPPAAQASAAAGASLPATAEARAVTPSSTLSIDIRPTAAAAGTGAPAVTGTGVQSTTATPQRSNVSDTPFTRNVSETPTPSTSTAGANGAPSPAAQLQGSSPGSSGPPSPAAQMQNRR